MILNDDFALKLKSTKNNRILYGKERIADRLAKQRLRCKLDRGVCSTL